MATEKNVLIVSAVVLAAVAVWLFLHRVTNIAGAGAPVNYSPTYLTYNNPNGNVITGTPTGISLAPVEKYNAPSSCGCGDSANGLAPNLNGLIDYFNTSIKDAYDKYNQATLNMLPYYVKQYFNQ
jgi:hypothetical protein